jgi:hypothetical protein
VKPAGPTYGERPLARGCQGADVVELQIRLAGFRGTLPDGEFGPGTERQVMSFQRDFMKMKSPSGIVDRRTMLAIDRFARRYPVDFRRLRCPCGKCGGFGSGRFRDEYVDGKPRTEAFHRYEYPGIHRMLLWAARAAWFYMGQDRFVITSGYRCGLDNDNHGRSTTNHHGKAVDFTFARRAKTRDARSDCNAVRGKLVETADAQVGWGARNRKALEPSEIAPTWVHYDVRCYESRYLGDGMFCRNRRELDDPRPIRFGLRRRKKRAGSRPTRSAR